MTDRLNKTSICSIVFLDIIDYSKKSVSEQIDDKTLFNALINEAIKNVAQNDRIILDTGDGAAITLMGAPEEALFVALTIRDGILIDNKTAEIPLLVRIGINLGSVRVVKDINGQPNIIGDGINVAQRIMSFAGENEILVSRSYYEVTSRLTKEITGMFTYSGVKQDKHVREHEVYLIKPKEIDDIKILDDAAILNASSNTGGTQSDLIGKIAKQSTLLLLGGAALIFLLLAWLILKPSAQPLESELLKTEKPLLDNAAVPVDNPPTDKVEKLDNKASSNQAEIAKQTDLKNTLDKSELSKAKIDKAAETKNNPTKSIDKKITEPNNNVPNKTVKAKSNVEDSGIKKKDENTSKKRSVPDQKAEIKHHPQATEPTKQETRPVLEHVCTQMEITLNQCRK